MWEHAHPRHLQEIVPQDPQAMERVPALWKDDSNEAVITLLDRCARAMVVDGKTLAVMGVKPSWEHVGEAWTVLSEEAITKHALSLTRGARDFINEIVERDDYWRLQAYVREGFWAGVEWAEWMGFRFEARMPRFSPDGATYWLYARISR